ncbi:MAG: PQQ-binding-like beta-propeller repeat protein [Opitutales bacterium]
MIFPLSNFLSALKSRKVNGLCCLSVVVASCFSISSAASVKPTYHEDLDQIRTRLLVEKEFTNRENYQLRIFMMKQWIASLQQMGVNTEAVLGETEILKANFPWNLKRFGGVAPKLTDAQAEKVFPAVDRGYAILEEIFESLGPLSEEPASSDYKQNVRTVGEGAKKQDIVYEDWPLYQKNIGHKGSVETDVVMAGEEAWKFPIGFAWEVQPVIEDGIVYAVSPGMRTMMYSLDLDTGEEIWKTKQVAPIVLDQLYWTPAAGSTPRMHKDKIIVRDIGSRGNNSDTRYSIIIDKKTGEIEDRIETGHVDYRTGYAPVVADDRFIVYPYGVHDIHEEPAVAGPFNRLRCKDVKTGRMLWEMFTGPTLAEPALLGSSVVTGTMAGKVFCFELKSPKKGVRPGAVRWQFKAEGGVNKTPLIADGKVIFGDNAGVIYCLSETNGTVLWKYDTHTPEARSLKNFSTPILANGNIYIGSADSHLYSLDVQTGDLNWKYRAADWVRSRPVVDGKRIYLASFDGTLVCLEDQGKHAVERWSEKVGTHQSLADLSFEDGKVLISTTDLYLWCYSETGELLWRKSLIESAYDGDYRILLEQVSGGAYFQSKVTAADGNVFFGTPSRFTHAVDSETGAELWRFELGAAISVAPSYYEGRIYVGQQGGEEYFYCIDANSGQKVWQQSIGWVWGSCNIAEGKVFVPCIDGYATALDARTGDIVWRHRANASVCTEPTIHGGDVIFGAWDKFIYSFDMHTGELNWTNFFSHGSDSGAMIAHEGKLYFPSPGNEFRSLDAATGKLDWAIHVPASIFNVTPAFNDEHVFASAMIGRMLGSTPVHCNVYKIDIHSQEIEWTHPGGGHTAPVVAGGRVYVGSLTSPYLYSLDEAGNGDGTTDLHWKFRMENRMEEACAAIYGDKIYILNSGGWVYAVE